MTLHDYWSDVKKRKPDMINDGCRPRGLNNRDGRYPYPGYMEPVPLLSLEPPTLFF